MLIINTELCSVVDHYLLNYNNIDILTIVHIKCTGDMLDKNLKYTYLLKNIPKRKVAYDKDTSVFTLQK